MIAAEVGRGDLISTDLVCDLAHVETSLVQYGQDTSVSSFHQLTDDLVVEVVHLVTEREMPTLK